MNKTVRLLDGVFAGIVVEMDSSTNQAKLMAFRDPIGVRPLFYGHTENSSWGFSSVLKGLSGQLEHIEPLLPGCWMELSFDMTLMNFEWSLHRYYHYHYPLSITLPSEKDYHELIRYKFTQAVVKRQMSDRPVCCLLSGGLDSSLVASILARNSTEPIHTFCCGMKGGTDFAWAKKVADHIGAIHHEVYFTEQDGLNAILPVAFETETWDITTIRASVGQYLVSKYVSENTDFKVVYIGDGSDELVGGYKYFCNAPSPIEFHKECVRLIRELHYYDVLRADRAVSCHGIETRVPFLDKEFINTYLNLPPELRQPKDGIEKYLLRKSFEQGDYLPKDVLWREKEAFSDGVSSAKKSWFEIIQQYINTQISDEYYQKNKQQYIHSPPHSKESLFYRELFASTFGDEYCTVIPKYWLPKWNGNVLEPSARVLSSYGRDKEDGVEKGKV